MMGAKAPVYNIPNMQPTPMDKSDKTFLAAIVFAILLVLVGIFGLPFWLNSKWQAEAAAQRSAAPFHIGDIVQSRIAKFRGTVIGVSCNKGCGYEVRFNVLSMEPQWVEEYEIQPVKKKAEK